MASWGGFPQTLGDSIDHLDASRVKTQHMDHGAYPKQTTSHDNSWLTIYCIRHESLQ